ncbi:cyanophycinase [Dyadobacter psychrotolerans]|uniref:Cyanophycinase n=1 Tax=Dyadobacter psychrotolerans TaxID=2541721 RepID=A0A4R5DT34_9BACT|nr:cyanophycinase [Dyadobacter psychrotolerans]TDE15430.1 cyanophycinase [Dyadobacter psychrotolerans]
MKSILSILLLLGISVFIVGAKSASAQPKQGTLLIIGGGNKSLLLLRQMVEVSKLTSSDYVAVLPMSSAFPDTSYQYFKTDMKPVCSNAIINLNFRALDMENRQKLDSLEKARLIFITGGDQERFMNVVLNTAVYNAIHKAFKNGATIAGTSAGAAVMSKLMISGRELVGDTTLRATFRKVHDQNIEIKQGLGLLTEAVIDQHFIVRSRYNRLLSAVARYPDLTCIGIDEATAIIVTGKKVSVVGESQVVVIRYPEKLKITKNGLISMQDVQFSMFTAGDSFLIGEK